MGRGRGGGGGGGGVINFQGTPIAPCRVQTSMSQLHRDVSVTSYYRA